MKPFEAVLLCLLLKAFQRQPQEPLPLQREQSSPLGGKDSEDVWKRAGSSWSSGGPSCSSAHILILTFDLGGGCGGELQVRSLCKQAIKGSRTGFDVDEQDRWSQLLQRSGLSVRHVRHLPRMIKRCER